jgi:hypothetical protein
LRNDHEKNKGREKEKIEGKSYERRKGWRE